MSPRQHEDGYNHEEGQYSHGDLDEPPPIHGFNFDPIENHLEANSREAFPQKGVSPGMWRMAGRFLPEALQRQGRLTPGR